VSDEGSAFMIGTVFAFFIVFLVSQFAESICQSENDVADCEWSQSPFTPVIPEATP